MIKRALPFFGLLLLMNCTSQKNANADILNSTSIKDIENFLESAHPDDPRKAHLKSKLIALKNAAWTKGAKTAKPMQARPIITELPEINPKEKGSTDNDDVEFQKLLSKTPEEHRKKTLKLLNALFNEDRSTDETILLVQNHSDCNLVLKIEGKEFYNLAVPSNGENSIVVKKGNYALFGSLCDVQYKSNKEISKNLMITLSNPK